MSDPSEDVALDQFRSILRPYHDRIEATVDLMRPDVRPSDYRRFLSRSFAFLARCERELDLDAAPVELDVRRRLKRPALAADLAALGIEEALVQGCAETPQVNSWPSALGYLYVVEGSTLGGQLLLRYLTTRLQLDETCTHFLSGYGAATGGQWKNFLAVLSTALERSAGERAQIAQTAMTTFTLLERCHAAE